MNNCRFSLSYLFSWAIFSLSEMSAVLTTASAFFLACSIFFNIYKNPIETGLNICPLSYAFLKPSWFSSLSTSSIWLGFTETATFFPHPSLLPGLSFSHPFDWPGIDLFPFLFVFLHHLLGDRERSFSVFTLIIQKPLWYFPWLIRDGKPKKKKKKKRNNQPFCADSKYGYSSNTNIQAVVSEPRKSNNNNNFGPPLLETKCISSQLKIMTSKTRYLPVKGVVY